MLVICQVVNLPHNSYERLAKELCTNYEVYKMCSDRDWSFRCEEMKMIIFLMNVV